MLDTGVRFCSWGYSRSRLHTGSSDGVLKVWDIFRATHDAHVMDVATFNSGIMSGAFNGDHSSLLIGEVNGSINVLQVGAESLALKNVESFRLEPADFAYNQKPTSQQTVEATSGIAASHSLLEDKRIELRPLGGLPIRQAVKGENYNGPYDYAPDALPLKARARQFQEKMEVANLKHQCQLPLCKDSAKHFAVEELIDSGRATDRIPQTMRDQLAEGANGSMITGMIKCSHCGGLARPRDDDTQQESFPLCERCGFACFRCGETIKLAPTIEKVSCRKCGLDWEVGALGYQLLPSDKNRMEDIIKHLPSGVATVEAVAAEPYTTTGGLDDLGDLLHLVKEYHHSLWEDRPRAVF